MKNKIGIFVIVLVMLAIFNYVYTYYRESSIIGGLPVYPAAKNVFRTNKMGTLGYRHVRSTGDEHSLVIIYDRNDDHSKIFEFYDQYLRSRGWNIEVGSSNYRNKQTTWRDIIDIDDYQVYTKKGNHIIVQNNSNFQGNSWSNKLDIFVY